MDFFLTVRKIKKITQYAVLTDFPYAKKEKKIVIRIVLYELSAPARIWGY